jgi:hypothetical protein
LIYLGIIYIREKLGGLGVFSPSKKVVRLGQLVQRDRWRKRRGKTHRCCACVIGNSSGNCVRYTTPGRKRSGSVVIAHIRAVVVLHPSFRTIYVVRSGRSRCCRCCCRPSDCLYVRSSVCLTLQYRVLARFAVLP